MALGARVTVASRGTAGRNRAVERGAEAIPTACVTQVLPGQEIVFNTAPAKVLDEAALRRADGGAMLIDLASLPYGIDLPAAWSLGLRARPAGALLSPERGAGAAGRHRTARTVKGGRRT